MSSSAGGPPRTLPALARIWDGVVAPFSVAALAESADVVFLALPEEAAAELAPAVLERGRPGDRPVRRVPAARRRRSGRAGTRTPGAAAVEPVYGLTERDRAALRDARLVACPGCYPDGGAARAGAAGRGGAAGRRHHRRREVGHLRAPARRRPSARTSPSATAACRPTACSGTGTPPEIEQELGTRLTFVPHLVPLDRGILETIYARLRPGSPTGAVRRRDGVGVRRCAVRAPDGATRCPRSSTSRTRTSATSAGASTRPADGSSSCRSSTTCVKGAAGQAVQNFNVVLGFDERAGLLG